MPAIESHAAKSSSFVLCNQLYILTAAGTLPCRLQPIRYQGARLFLLNINPTAVLRIGRLSVLRLGKRPSAAAFAASPAFFNELCRLSLYFIKFFIAHSRAVFLFDIQCEKNAL